MKRTLAPIILACAIALGGCSTLQGVVTWATQKETTAAEAHTVAGATQLATGLLKAANAYQKTDKCDAACSQVIADYSHAIRTELDKALDAEIAGDSFKVQAALDAFNAVYPKLKTFLAHKGVSA